MYTALGSINGVAETGAGGGAVVMTSLATDTAAVLLRDNLPWRSVAAWTHRLPTTVTDRWMDVVDGAVRGPNHRWLHHHPIDFMTGKLNGEIAGRLSYKSYLAHVFCDVITVKGLPLLPQSLHQALVAAGVSPATLYAWTHLNIVDLAVGFYSLGTGVSWFVMAVTGQLPWGVETLFLTLGGAVEIGFGFYMTNPLLVLGGGLKIAAGGVSLVRWLTLPEPSLFQTLLPGILGGLAGGGAAAALQLALTWNTTETAEKVAAATETIALGAVLGTLAAVNPWISIPLGVAYSAGKFAWSLARRPAVQSDMTSALEIIERIEGPEPAAAFGKKIKATQVTWPPAPPWA